MVEILYDTVRDRRKTLKIEKKKRKMRKRKSKTTAINIFLLLLFSVEKLIFC